MERMRNRALAESLCGSVESGGIVAFYVNFVKTHVDSAHFTRIPRAIFT